MGSLILEVDGHRFDGGADGNQWIAKEGLDGWWDSAETNYDESNQEDRDGAFDPAYVNLGPRRVDVVAHMAASSPAWADTVVRDWAAALSKKTDIRFRVYHEGRWLSLRKAKIRGQVKIRPNRNDMRLTTVSFTAWAANPLKYGPLKALPIEPVRPDTGGLEYPLVDGSLDFGGADLPEFPGAFQITNPGTAEVYPRFTILGPASSFTITSESYVVAYDGAIAAGEELTLSPHAGGRAAVDGVDVSQNLTQADWVPVSGGETRGYLFEPVDATAGTKLTVEYEEGAWY